MSTNEETIQRRYQAIIDQEDDCTLGISKLEGLVELTGVEPSDELLKRVYLTALEEPLSEVDGANLVKFSKRHNISGLISEEDVQDIYGRFLEEGSIHCVEDVAKISGIVPEFDEEQVQRAYVKSFQQGFYTGHILSFQRFSGIEPRIPEHLIQVRYSEYFSKGFSQRYPLSVLRELKELTGVVPVFDPVEVQDRFRTLLEARRFGEAIELKGILDVEFPTEVISDLYSSMVENGLFGLVYDLERATGISPNRRLMEDKYRTLLNEGDFGVARSLKSDFGVNLKLNDAEVQKLYSGFPKNLNFYGTRADLYNVKELAELTGISPNDDNVQRWYVSLIENGDFEVVSELQKLTGIEPSEEVLRSLEDHLRS